MDRLQYIVVLALIEDELKELSDEPEANASLILSARIRSLAMLVKSLCMTIRSKESEGLSPEDLASIEALKSTVKQTLKSTIEESLKKGVPR